MRAQAHSPRTSPAPLDMAQDLTTCPGRWMAAKSVIAKAIAPAAQVSDDTA